MYVQVLIHNLHTKFYVPNITHSKDTTGGHKILKFVL